MESNSLQAFYLMNTAYSVDDALRDAKFSFKDLDEVILVGGSTRIPAVKEFVRKMTGKEPTVIVNPEEVVSLEAAVQLYSFVKMKPCGFFFFFFMHTFFAFWCSYGVTRASVSASVEKTIVVDKSGAGNFTTIQSAFDSISSDNQHWIRILVKPAIYREQVKLTKPFLLLEGDINDRPTMSWDNAESLQESPTFHVSADNFVAKWVNIENTFNYPNKTNKPQQAVALQVSSDKSSFHECGFYSVQDTLWDDVGRHYFKNCHIEGLVDFIFGEGQSIYESCNLTVLPGAGYVTAQARDNLNETNGFVFKSCALEGKGKTYLGRPWRAYARVLFFESYLSSIVFPEGWQPWDQLPHIGNVTFAEHGCYGEGASTTGRVKWEKILNEEQLQELTSLSYIDNEGWLEQQP